MTEESIPPLLCFSEECNCFVFVRTVLLLRTIHFELIIFSSIQPQAYNHKNKNMMVSSSTVLALIVSLMMSSKYAAADFVNSHCDSNTPAATGAADKVTITKEVNNLCGGADDHYYWELPIPAGADNVYCKTWGGEGNVALYTRWDANIDIFAPRDNTCISNNEEGCDTMEECSGDELKPYGNVLHVGVYSNNEAFCNVSVTCSYEIDQGSADNTPDYSVKNLPSTSCAPVCQLHTQRRGLRAASR